jgi:hypothetical protein
MPSNNISEGLRKVVDSHGYGFHYAVIKTADRLFPDKSPWIFKAAEVPVAVRGQDTRIDFILRHKDRPIYLICECKRANPALNHWCFLRVPYVKRNYGTTELITEGVKYAPEVAAERRIITGPKYPGYSDFVYGLAFEMKSEEKGDATGSGRGEIEKAATQVMRGLNGFVEFFSNHPEVLENEPSGKPALLVPVIFTTAQVFVTETNVSDADVKTGKLTKDDIGLSDRPWLWYRYHQSPGIRHTLTVIRALFSARGEADVDVGTVVNEEFARTIAVVNAAGIEAFLNSPWFEYL